MKLDFIGLGVQKAGTTTIHDILKQNPSIFLPESKEAHFFDLTERFKRGIGYLNDHFFQNAQETQIIGKFTPDYFYMPLVPERIKTTFGTNLKFIVIVRNPVKRAISHYNMTFRRGQEDLSFENAILQEKKRVSQGEWEAIRYAYIGKGLYAAQLERYLTYFPIENFLFLRFEDDLLKDMPSCISTIEHFIGIQHFQRYNFDIHANEGFKPKFVKVNTLLSTKNPIKSLFKTFIPRNMAKKIKSNIFSVNKSETKEVQYKMSPSEEAVLFDTYFKQDTERLELLTGLNLSAWKYS